MLVNCAGCGKAYTDRMAKCPFCNTPGPHAPPPATPPPAAPAPAEMPVLPGAPIASPADATLPRDLTPEARMLLATMEMEMAARKRKRGVGPVVRAGRVLMGMAVLNVLISVVLFAAPVNIPEDTDLKAAGVAGLITALIVGGLGIGAMRGIRACVWIGAALYALDIVISLASKVFAGVMFKVIVMFMLVRLAFAMTQED
jgi:hypothetical protein